MNNLNSVLIEGNMVRDPQSRNTPKGSLVCNFTIASNRYYRQGSNLEKEVGYFDVETWGKLAEACSTQGHKGRGVRVVGRLKQDRWAGNDGKNHSRIAIVAEHVEYRADFKKAESTDIDAVAMAHAAAAAPAEIHGETYAEAQAEVHAGAHAEAYEEQQAVAF